jgi:hypothetical protein
MEMIAIAFTILRPSCSATQTVVYIKNVRLETRSIHAGAFIDVTPPPTVFFHADYDAHDQYPQGIANTVGYWAEYQTLRRRRPV